MKAKNAGFYLSIFAGASLFIAECLYAGAIEPRVVDEVIEFSYADRKAKSVSIAGEFNNWTPEKDFLKYDFLRNLWFIRLNLAVGRYEYKYLIDGKWMPGANLVVEIRKKDGRLYIPKPKVQPPNTPFSNKIHFGSKIIALATDSPDDANAVGKNIHADFDWHILASKDITAFVRIEYDYSQEPRKILFKQGYMDIEPDALKENEFNARVFYKTKSVQFKNPLKITDRSVGLKYKVIEFYDEINPQRAFGLWEQGVSARMRLFGGEAEIFYADLLSPTTTFSMVSDSFGARYFYKMKELPFAFGATYFGRRGQWWPYANRDNNWFPNPETINGYSNKSDNRNSAQPWYKGFINSDFAGVDAKFYFLPWMEFFAESAGKSTDLKTERFSGDIPFERIWNIEKNNVWLYGTKIKFFDNFGVEISHRTDDISFKPPFLSENIRANNTSINGVMRYDTKNFTAGVSYKNATSGDMASGIPIDIHPYRKQILYDGLFPYSAEILGHFVRAVKNEMVYMPYVKYYSDFLELTMKSERALYDILPQSVPSSDVNTTSEGAPQKLSVTQNLADLSLKIARKFYLENTLRYLAWDGLNLRGDYFAGFYALKYKFSKNIYVRLGYGFDPDGFDDDISSDFDKREEFLSAELKKFGDVLAAEQKLSDYNRISLRFGILF